MNPTQTMTPRMPAWGAEIKLLLCCARAQMDAACARQVKDLVQQGCAWPLLFQTATGQGVLPLLYRNLAATCRDEIPPDALAAFSRLAHTSAAHNLFRTNELGRLLSLFREGGIRAIPFKGPVLSQLAYGDVKIRQFNDLDILIPRDAFSAAEQLLLAAGYAPDKELSGLRKALFLHLECEFPFARGGRIFRVDLHTGIGPRRFASVVDFDALWARAERVEVEGIPMPSLSLPDQLQILCYHGSKHRWEALRYICDVADLVRSNPEIDWDVVLERARRMRSERMLLCGIRLAYELLDIDLPEEMRRHIYRDKQLGALTRRVLEDLFDVPLDETGFGERLQFHLRIRDSLSAKARYSSHALFFNTWIRARLGV